MGDNFSFSLEAQLLQGVPKQDPHGFYLLNKRGWNFPFNRGSRSDGPSTTGRGLVRLDLPSFRSDEPILRTSTTKVNQRRYNTYCASSSSMVWCIILSLHGHTGKSNNDEKFKRYSQFKLKHTHIPIIGGKRSNFVGSFKSVVNRIFRVRSQSRTA